MASFTGVLEPTSSTDGGYTRGVATRTGAETAAPLTDSPHTREGANRTGDFVSLDLMDAGYSRLVSYRSGELIPVTRDIGYKIPTGEFVPVLVTVKDTEGTVLTNVDLVMSSGIFPTAAAVNDNGRARLWLLELEYTSFMAIAEEPVDNATVKFTWFSSHDKQPAITPATETEADIVLEPERIESGQGLSVGQGNIHIGSVFD